VFVNVFDFSLNKDTSQYTLSSRLGGELEEVPAGRSRSRRSPSALTERAYPSQLHLESYIILPYICTPTSTSSSNIRIDYAIRRCWTQASKVRSGWPRFCQYLPVMLCSCSKPVNWPAISAHQVGVTNFQRLHASHACHSIATPCTYRHAVLRQAQRVALPSPQSGSMALCEANQACWLPSCLHEALPCRQP
jgi:hypothetical protein